MNERYEPDSRFLDRLEWQLSSEYRRMGRLKSPAGKIAIPRTVVAIAVVVGILTTGAAVTKAADYIRDSWRKKIEMARVETEVELKKVHLESLWEMAAETEDRFSNGMIREEEFRAMQLAVENADLDLQRSLLNLDEVRMSGDAPRNELYSPIVGGRDFVSERLEMERKAVRLSMKQLGVHLERARSLSEQKMIRESELAQLQAEMDNQKTMIDDIQRRLELREQYLAGVLSAKQVEIQDRLTGAEKNLRIARSRIEMLQGQMSRLETLAAQKLVNQMEVIQMQHALDAARAELKLAELEVDVLEKLR